MEDTTNQLETPMETPKDPTPAEQTARLLLLRVIDAPKTEVKFESVIEFLNRGGLAKTAKAANAFNSQKPQTMPKAKRTRSFRHLFGN